MCCEYKIAPCRFLGFSSADCFIALRYIKDKTFKKHRNFMTILSLWVVLDSNQ